MGSADQIKETLLSKGFRLLERYHGVNQLHWIRCSIGHQFKTRLNNFVYTNRKCPVCLRYERIENTNQKYLKGIKILDSGELVCPGGQIIRKKQQSFRKSPYCMECAKVDIIGQKIGEMLKCKAFHSNGKLKLYYPNGKLEDVTIRALCSGACGINISVHDVFDLDPIKLLSKGSRPDRDIWQFKSRFNGEIVSTSYNELYLGRCKTVKQKPRALCVILENR